MKLYLYVCVCIFFISACSANHILLFNAVNKSCKIDVNDNTILIINDGLACSSCINSIIDDLKNLSTYSDIYFVYKNEGLVSNLKRKNYFKKQYNKKHSNIKNIYFDSPNEDNSLFNIYSIKRTPAILISRNNKIHYVSYDTLFQNGLSKFNLKKILESHVL